MKRTIYEGTYEFKPSDPSALSFTEMVQGLYPIKEAWRAFKEVYLADPDTPPTGFAIEVTVKSTISYQVKEEPYDAIC